MNIHGKDRFKVYCNVHHDYVLTPTIKTCPVCLLRPNGFWSYDGYVDPISYYGTPGYPEGTEYFDGYDWKPIEDYSGGTIMVYDPETKMIIPEVPSEFYEREGEIIHFKALRYHISVGDGTKMYLKKRRSRSRLWFPFTPYAFYKERHQSDKETFISTFRVEETFLDDDDMFKFLCHVYLAKTKVFKPRYSDHCLMSFKPKEDKRFEALLDKLGFEYETREIEGFVNSYTYIIRGAGITSIEIPREWYRLPSYYHTLARETLASGRYVTLTSKKAADFIQFGCYVSGMIPVLNMEESSLETLYQLAVTTNRSNVFLSSKEIWRSKGKLYGFKTTTHFLPLRQNNFIFIATDGQNEEERSSIYPCIGS